MRLIWLDQDDSEADEGAVTPTVPPKIWFLFRTPTCSYRNNHLPIVKLTLFNWRKLPGRSQTPPLPQIRNWNLNLIEFAENINLNLINTFFIFFHCIPVSEIKLCICLSPTLPHPTTSLQLYLLPLVSNILFQIVTMSHLWTACRPSSFSEQTCHGDVATVSLRIMTECWRESRWQTWVPSYGDKACCTAFITFALLLLILSPFFPS